MDVHLCTQTWGSETLSTLGGPKLSSLSTFNARMLESV